MLKTEIKRKKLSVSKEVAYIAITCALLIGGQFVFSFIAGVEIVTLILVSFSYVFGARRGAVCAAAFSLLLCIIYGFYPTVAILYFIYYPLLATVFGLLGNCKRITSLHNAKGEILKVILIAAAGAVMTAIFTLLDDLITPLFFGLSHEAAVAYFYGSLTVMLPQVICTVVTICTLFLPLTAVFRKAANF